MTRQFEIRSVEVEGEMKDRPVDIATGKAYASKSQVASFIFNEVIADESITEKRQRSAFINRCIAELNMSTSGASTYFYNKRMKAAGGNEYQHNINSAQRKAAKEAEATATEETSQQTEAELLRWRVVLKDSRKIVETFAGRKAAQEFNKEQKAAGKQTVMVDGNKEAKSA